MFESDSGPIVRLRFRAQNGRCMRLSQRVRTRLRDELGHLKISQRVTAERLTTQTGELWTQSKVHKILTGQVQLLVDDMELLAGIVGVTLVELTREPGREFVADLTPSELRLLNAIRDNPEMLAHVMGIIGAAQRRKPSRRTVRERMASPE